MEAIAPTDTIPPDDIRPVLMGLFGEVGSIMATAKKRRREKEAYAGYQHAVEEEFGDVLWYLAAICRRLDLSLDDIFSDATSAEGYSKSVAASDHHDGSIPHVSSVEALPPLDETFLNLGEAAATLLGIRGPDERTQILLRAFANQ